MKHGDLIVNSISNYKEFISYLKHIQSYPAQVTCVTHILWGGACLCDMFALVRMCGPAYLGMSHLQMHQETLQLICCYREAHCLDMDVTQSSSLTLSCRIMWLCLPHRLYAAGPLMWRLFLINTVEKSKHPIVPSGGMIALWKDCLTIQVITRMRLLDSLELLRWNLCFSRTCAFTMEWLWFWRAERNVTIRAACCWDSGNSQ